MSIFNYVKEYNYISDYFTTVYNYYVHAHKSFPVTFYDIDKPNTIWDNENFDSTSGATGLRGGSYESGDVGELSGVLFKKIMLLPVHQLDQINPQFETGDRGYTAHDSLVTTFTIPKIYGLNPHAKCVVDLNFGLNNTEDKVLYQVTNVATAHFGSVLQVWKCDCRVAPFNKEDIEQQLSSIWTFYEPTKQIIPSTYASLLVKLMTRANNVSTNIRELYDNGVDLFFEKVDVV